MAPGKKFLSPTLYPLNRDITRKWFIKYYEEDFKNGGFCSHKYIGLLNRVADKQQRLALAENYLQLMRAGEALNDYQGQRHIRPLQHAKSNTNVIECCKRFIKQKQVEGIKHSTVTDYTCKVNIFGAWLQTQQLQNKPIGAIDKDTAIEFLLSLKARGLANSSFNDYRMLFAAVWTEYQDRIQRNPWKEIKPLRHTPTHLESYTAHLQQHIQKTLPAYNPQLWLFMQCIYYAAIRPHSELRFLKIRHIDFIAGTITVPAPISKNRKARTVNIYRGLLQQLQQQGYEQYPGEHYIFSYNGTPGAQLVGENYFANRWNDYRKEHNIDARYKLYGSKHTGGKNLTKKTNAYITQQHMDHSSIAMTENYIDGLDKNELKFLQVEFPQFAG